MLLWSFLPFLWDASSIFLTNAICGSLSPGIISNFWLSGQTIHYIFICQSCFTLGGLAAATHEMPFHIMVTEEHNLSSLADIKNMKTNCNSDKRSWYKSDTTFSILQLQNTCMWTQEINESLSLWIHFQSVTIFLQYIFTLEYLDSVSTSIVSVGYKRFISLIYVLWQEKMWDCWMTP